MTRGNASSGLTQGIVAKSVRALRRVERKGAAVSANAVARMPGGEVKLAKWASQASADFMPWAEVQMTGRERPRTRRLPLIIMQSYPGSEVELADLADEDSAAHPNFLERIAARLALEGDYVTALRLRRRAVELDPETAHRHLALAQGLLEIPAQGVVHDWILGLAQGPTTPISEEVLQALRRSFELAPGNPYVLHEYGTALIATGEVGQALPLLEIAILKRPDQEWYLELAEIYRRPDIAKFEQAMIYYERVFEDDPKNMKAISGIINSGTRGSMDWPRIWRSVRRLETNKKRDTPYDIPVIQYQLDKLFWGADHPSQEHVALLIQALEAESHRDRRLHPAVLGLVITRLQFARHFAAGFALRTGVAQERLRTLRKKPIDSPTALRNLMKVYVYLDEAETAASLADVKFWPSKDRIESLQIQKLHADARLWVGDAAPYIKYSKEARTRTPLTADYRMEKLIRGNRVALVGPAETGDRLGHIIDEYDVVVRPRYQPEFIEENKHAQGSRTDITYYSGQDLTSLFEGISAAVERGEVKVVNARPFSYSAHAHRQLPWLRFYRQDFSLCFHGGSLGIQRMAYDLLQFEPEEICVFNSDLYTGSSMFTAGWRQGDAFGPYSHINDIVVSHDVKSEFKFMKALMATGIVTAQGRAAEVLAQSPDEYVHAIEEAGVLR